MGDYYDQLVAYRGVVYYPIIGIYFEKPHGETGRTLTPEEAVQLSANQQSGLAFRTSRRAFGCLSDSSLQRCVWRPAIVFRAGGRGRVAGVCCRSTAGKSCPEVTGPVLAEAAGAPRYLVEG